MGRPAVIMARAGRAAPVRRADGWREELSRPAMPITDPNPQALILRLCADAAPNPWYPSAWVREQGISRDDVDPFLDQLRMGGLIRLTDWVAGHGQGYALTEE